MNCLILAGGKGTRLQTVVKDRPKPMAEIGGKPFLEILMEYLKKFEASHFILCTSYMSKSITSYFGDSFKDIPISYAFEPVPLGTGGAIKNGFINCDLDSALVLNGDTFLRTDYNKFWNYSLAYPLTVLLTRVEDVSRYGEVKTESGYITRFYEKSGQKHPGLINAGTYKIDRKIALSLPDGNFSFETDYLAKNTPELKVKYFMCEDYFIDIGLPESYAEARLSLV